MELHEGVLHMKSGYAAPPSMVSGRMIKFAGKFFWIESNLVLK